jgi:TPR repeat protein
MANLGVCYDRGQGVERDPARAAEWYRQGAAAGNGRAMANLGVCYA